MVTTGKAIIEVRADTSRADKQIKSSAAGITSAMRTIGVAFSGYMVANFFRDASKAARDFEDDLANINSLLGKSHSMYGQYREDLLKLKQAVPVLELHDLSMGLYESISAGVDAADAMDATTTMAYAAAGGQAELSTVVKGTTTLMNAYKMSTDEAMEATDIGLSTVRAAKLHYDEYASGISMVAGSAAVAGVSVKDLHAAIAVAARVQEPAQAFTGLNMAISSLYSRKPELAKMGIEVTTFADTMRQLHERQMSMSEWTKVVPDLRSRRTLQAIDLQYEDFTETLETFDDVSGTTMEMFGTRTEEAGFKMAAMAARVEDAKIAIGQDLNVALAENITLLDAFGNRLTEIHPELGAVVDKFDIWDLTLMGMTSHWGLAMKAGDKFGDWLMEHLPGLETAARGYERIANAISRIPGLEGLRKKGEAPLAGAWGETVGAWGAGEMPGLLPEEPGIPPKKTGKGGKRDKWEMGPVSPDVIANIAWAQEDPKALEERSKAQIQELTKFKNELELEHQEERHERILEQAEMLASYLDPSQAIINGLRSGDMKQAMQDFAVNLGAKVSEELLSALFMQGLLAILNIISGGATSGLQMAMGRGGVVRAASGLVSVLPSRPGGWMIPWGNKMINAAEAGQPEVAAFLPPGGRGRDIILNQLHPMFNIKPQVDTHVETRPSFNTTIKVEHADRHHVRAHNDASAGKVNKAVTVRK